MKTELIDLKEVDSDFLLISTRFLLKSCKQPPRFDINRLQLLKFDY